MSAIMCSFVSVEKLLKKLFNNIFKNNIEMDFTSLSSDYEALTNSFKQNLNTVFHKYNILGL
jgi:hypothetical protein